MKEIRANIWTCHDQGQIVIPTNGFVKANGCCVMGRGLAQQAAKKYQRLPEQLGSLIKEKGNHVHWFPIPRLVSFPVKHNWWEKADPELIGRSMDEIMELSKRLPGLRFFMPRVGCGNGQLDWFMVKPLLNCLSDKFTVVDLKGD